MEAVDANRHLDSVTNKQLTKLNPLGKMKLVKLKTYLPAPLLPHGSHMWKPIQEQTPVCTSVSVCRCVGGGVISGAQNCSDNAAHLHTYTLTHTYTH